ncbi:DUF6346 domain-containing protein [Lentzea sp. NPDC058450]|uniref:DUF6346 domain-containing protein n=1 Tax=Lentzea sp. NPDC058450 TaxID=3346505 RepID=UPI00364C1012
MTVVRVLHRFSAFLLVPVLGYLLGATIFNHFWNKVETDLHGADLVITATSCERSGPLTLRGFGYVYDCRAKVENKTNGNVTTATTRGFLTPELIGTEVAGSGFRRGELYPERPYAGWGMALLLPFGVLWFYVYIRIAWPLLPERRKARRKPVRYQRPDSAAEPDRTVRVFGGHRRVWLFVVFLLGCAGVFIHPASWAVVGLVLLAVAWQALRGPMIAVSPDGLAWRGTSLTWAEIRDVRLTRRNFLLVQPRNGEEARIGRFGTEQATRIHVAMGHFAQAPYVRDDVVLG